MGGWVVTLTVDGAELYPPSPPFTSRLVMPTNPEGGLKGPLWKASDYERAHDLATFLSLAMLGPRGEELLQGLSTVF
jgi:hypothetical protein